MTVGMSKSTADAVLAAIFQGTSFAITAIWVQLHIGDPGGAGTNNLAAETVRVNATGCFGTAAADDGTGTKEMIANTIAVGPWTSVTATETYTHVSFWTASTGGTYIGSGVLTTPQGVTAGQNFTIPIGDLTAKLPKAA